MCGSVGIPAPHGHSGLTHITNPVGGAHTRTANGLQIRSTHLRPGSSTQLKAWPSLHSLKQLSQYQRILMEHKQPSESQRVRKTLKAGHAKKKIHIHNMGWRVSDLSSMMKITRSRGKCWDVTCLLYATVFLPLLLNFTFNFRLLHCLTNSLAWSLFLSLSLNLFTTNACEQR